MLNDSYVIDNAITETAIVNSDVKVKTKAVSVFITSFNIHQLPGPINTVSISLLDTMQRFFEIKVGCVTLTPKHDQSPFHENTEHLCQIIPFMLMIYRTPFIGSTKTKK